MLDLVSLYNDYKWYVIIGAGALLFLVVYYFFLLKSISQPKIKPVETGSGPKVLQRVAPRFANIPEIQDLILAAKSYEELFEVLSQLPKGITYKIISAIYYDLYVERDQAEFETMFEALSARFSLQEIDVATKWTYLSKQAQPPVEEPVQEMPAETEPVDFGTTTQSVEIEDENIIKEENNKE